MTRENQKMCRDNTQKNLRHWRVIRMPFGETRLLFSGYFIH